MSKKVTLADVCTLRNGRAYKKPELLSEGKYPVLRVGNFFTSDNWYYSDLELDDTKYCDTGDLLYAWSASFGARIWDGEKVIYHYHIWRVDVETEIIDKKFLFYWFEFDKEKIKKESGTGTTMMHVSKGSMEKRELWLPSLAEQQRIVAKLDAAFAEIDRAAALTEAKLTEAQNLLDASVAKIFDDNLTGAEHFFLNDVVTRLTNGYVGATKNIYQDKGIPYLLARHVRNNTLTFDGKTFVSSEFNSKNKKSILKQDDVLLVQSGHIGHTAVVPKEHEGHNCHAMIVITTVKNALSGEYLSALFNSCDYKVKLLSLRTGSTVPHLNCGDVKKVRIPIPNKDTQERIISLTKSATASFAKIDALLSFKLVQLNKLRGAILATELQPTQSKTA